ncbi:MAG: heavy-metal-associated domain-containing protein [Aliihoeflea sp.]|uniref:heavy-metal-associated domain-containing protein n=1 Tax=Aliihoeflea sp. TaxID=2608088 RepID=UPI00403375E8
MQIDLEIGGMTCGGCVRSVTRVLEAVPGVNAANVDLEKARAQIEGEALDAATLIAAVEDAGFDARQAK